MSTHKFVTEEQLREELSRQVARHAVMPEGFARTALAASIGDLTDLLARYPERLLWAAEQKGQL